MAQTYEDKPTLEAFNGKLDRELLLDYTVEEAKSSVELDVSGIEWENYFAVALVVRPASSVNRLTLAPHGDSGGSWRQLNGTQTGSGLVSLTLEHPSVTVFFPAYCADVTLNTMFFAPPMIGASIGNKTTFRNLQILHLISTDVSGVPAGTNVCFYGIR